MYIYIYIFLRFSPRASFSAQATTSRLAVADRKIIVAPGACYEICFHEELPNPGGLLDDGSNAGNQPAVPQEAFDGWSDSRQLRDAMMPANCKHLENTHFCGLKIDSKQLPLLQSTFSRPE